jgi:phage tail sheath protein FI
MDGAWKYQYDRYRDIFLYVPMNGDMAGLCARTDFTNDAWWSPAGLTRGTVKNIVKLSWEPTKANRDTLYPLSVNPLITQKGAGVVLWGDKTMQTVPSAFDRINVRRLFIVLEKAISIAAKAMLFEFNDEFTRSQFVNMVEPFLREVKGRRGITDFKVVCDTSNNTGQVIDTNNFVGDIYIKPNRSINFIQLNFIAARTDVSFSEIGG